jgi:hypothetical protein
MTHGRHGNIVSHIRRGVVGLGWQPGFGVFEQLGQFRLFFFFFSSSEPAIRVTLQLCNSADCGPGDAR